MIRDFKPEDYFAIKDPIDRFPEEVTRENIESAMKSGVCVTAVDNDEVIGCGGAIVTGENEAELWVRLSQKVQAIKFKAVEVICSGMRVITESLEGFSFKCKVAENFEVGERLVSWLGFKKTSNVEMINNTKYFIYRL